MNTDNYRNIKLIITDIDGTLLDEGDTHLNPEYFTVIRDLIEHDVHFVFASGRHASSMRRTFTPIQDLVWVVSQNGSVIEHAGTTRVPHPIPREIAAEFWKDLGSYELTDSLLNTAERTYCPFDHTQMYRLVRDRYKFDIHATGGWNNLPPQDISMLTIYHPESAEGFSRNSGFFDRWSDRLNLIPTGKVWVDCMMPGISKGDALLYICEELGIDPSNTMSFGDNMNDISMIRAAGIGFAVDTAREEVQNAADHVIPGHHCDGVLIELKKVLQAVRQNDTVE